NYLFDDVLRQDGELTVENIIATFISFLELARLGKVTIFQNEEDSKIYIHVLDALENFDLDSANGFADFNTNDDAPPATLTSPEAAPTIYQ
ncbi:MAG: hypothetical protein WCG27_01015, partial [Pseudomonadota bacterium]